ncbi:MAG TPA: PH domain-containing protein [Candidatus Saccharimonadales bacterium]|nr:PH domain-containing protein [Candidatus Saccharimonadales bacterium]
MGSLQQFEGQYDDEEVLLVFRRHIIALRKGLYIVLIATIIGTIPVLIAPTSNTPFFIFIGVFIIGLCGFFYHWVGWYFSAFVVTNLRFRQLTYGGFFQKSVIDIGLNKIQNISYNIPGFTGSVFGFGTLVIQTYVGDLALDKVPHPDKLYETLHRIIKERDADQSENDAFQK